MSVVKCNTSDFFLNSLKNKLLNICLLGAITLYRYNIYSGILYFILKPNQANFCIEFESDTGSLTLAS